MLNRSYAGEGFPSIVLVSVYFSKGKAPQSYFLQKKSVCFIRYISYILQFKILTELERYRDTSIASVLENQVFYTLLGM